MTMRAITLLSTVLQIGFPNLLAIEDYAIVSGQHGYLLNDREVVVDTVPSGHIFQVTSVEGDYLVVDHLGEKLRLHRRVCHRTSDWKFANKINALSIFQSLELLRLADAASAVDNHERALKLCRQAAEATIDNPFDERLPLYARALQSEAYQHYALEDYVSANNVLDQCDAEVTRLSLQQDPFYADILNTRALVCAAEERYDEAAKLYQQAIEIFTAASGPNHVDCGILHDNLSYAYESTGDLDAAIASELLCLEVYKSVYPTSAEEIALAQKRLGELWHGNEDYEQAISAYEVALRSLVIYHPHLLFEIADTRENLIYTNRLLGNFDAAEKTCRDLIQSLRKFAAVDQLPYRKRSLLRLGTIDFDRENYEAALAHYLQAGKLIDEEAYDADDGIAFENAGDALVQLDRLNEAKAVYEQAIEIYIAVEGPESENLVTARDSLAALTSAGSRSLDEVVLVAQPQAYLLDDEGNSITAIPGLTVLKWLAKGDGYHEVQYEGNIGRINDSQLHIGKQIPGYGSVSADSLRLVTASMASAVTATKAGDVEPAKTHLNNARKLCELDDIKNSTLDLWQQITGIAVTALIEGPTGLDSQLEQLSEQIESVDSNEDSQIYPLLLDVRTAVAFVQLQERLFATAVEEQNKALAIAEQNFGPLHTVTFKAVQRLAKALFLAEEQSDSIAAFSRTISIARKLYPPKSAEIGESIRDLSIALAQTNKLDEAKTLLEELLQDPGSLPEEGHALALATLGKIHVAQRNAPDARKRLDPAMKILQKIDALNGPAALMTYSALGELEVATENWQAAITTLQAALVAHKALDSTETFEASQIHRLLAKAYEGVNDRQSAVVQFRRVLQIYDTLGGGDSELATDVREHLKSMDLPDESPVQNLISQYFSFGREHELMLVVREKCSVFADSSPQSKTIGNLEVDATAWSLEQRDGRHRIYVKALQQFGWIDDQVATPQPELLMEKALADLKVKLPETNPDFGTIITTLDTSSANGFADNAEAIAALETALNLLKKYDSDGRYFSALLLGHLGELYEQNGETLKSFDAFDRQLSPLLFSVGFDHPLVAANRLKQSNHAARIGDLPEQKSHLNEMVATCAMRFGPDDPRTLTRQLGLAAVQFKTGFLESAREIYERQIKAQKPDDKTDFLAAAAHLGMAGLEASSGNMETAAQHAEDSLDVMQALGHPIPDLTVQAIVILGHAAGQMGEFEEALDILTQANDFAVQVDPDVYLQAIVQMATIAAHGGEADAALRIATKGDELAQQTFGNNSFRRHDVLQAKGRALHHENPVDAAAAYDEARRLALDYINDVVAFDKIDHRISFVSADDRHLDEALSLALQTESASADAHPDLAHGLGNSPAATETAAWMLTFHNVLPRLVARENRSRAVVRDQFQYDSLFLWECDREARARLPLHTQPNMTLFQIAEVNKQFLQKERKYYADIPLEARLLVSEKLAWLTPANVRGKLDSDEVLVLIRELKPAYRMDAEVPPVPPQAASRQAYAAWLIPGKADGVVQAFELAHDANEIQLLVDESLKFAPSINETRFHPDDASQQQLSTVSAGLRKLSDAVWKPIHDRLPKSTRKLVFCLDGDLRRVPWVALATDDGRTVLDDFESRHLSSPRDLMISDSAPALGKPSMFAESIPEGLDNNLSEIPQQTIELLSRRTQTSDNPFTWEFRESISQAESDRRGGEGEVAAFAKIFAPNASNSPELFTGTQASEFRFLLQNRPQSLHIGAYGVVAEEGDNFFDLSFPLSQSRMLLSYPSDSVANPLLRCGLLLTGFSQGNKTHHLQDGVLTGAEIATLDLRGTELVTLSQAVRATIYYDVSDAATLLPQAFQLAGAQSVLSPLWQMDQKSNIEFLTVFYQQLGSGKSKAAALRAAQLQMRDSGRNPQGKSTPFNWAAFRLTGRD